MCYSPLGRFGNRQPAIVLKIETRRGFENLPDMLLAAMRGAYCGVMIARGDLATRIEVRGTHELARLAEMIQDGLRDAVQAELMGRGYQAGQVHSFMSDLTALPAAMIVPQTTSAGSTDVGIAQSPEE